MCGCPTPLLSYPDTSSALDTSSQVPTAFYILRPSTRLHGAQRQPMNSVSPHTLHPSASHLPKRSYNAVPLPAHHMFQPVTCGITTYFNMNSPLPAGHQASRHGTWRRYTSCGRTLQT